MMGVQAGIWLWRVTTFSQSGDMRNLDFYDCGEVCRAAHKPITAT